MEYVVETGKDFLFCNKPFLRIKNLFDTKPSCDFNRKIRELVNIKSGKSGLRKSAKPCTSRFSSLAS
jgi:hypothetical protein